jgi:hypothetical protein
VGHVIDFQHEYLLRIEWDVFLSYPVPAPRELGLVALQHFLIDSRPGRAILLFVLSLAQFQVRGVANDNQQRSRGVARGSSCVALHKKREISPRALSMLTAG